MSGDTADLGCVTVLEWPANVLLTIKTLMGGNWSVNKAGRHAAICFICSQATAVRMTQSAGLKEEVLPNSHSRP